MAWLFLKTWVCSPWEWWARADSASTSLLSALG